MIDVILLTRMALIQKKKYKLHFTKKKHGFNIIH